MIDDQQEISADTPLGKYAYRGRDLNTPATFVTLILVCLIGYMVFTHQQEARFAGEAFVAAVKEQTLALRDQTSAIRENSCLQRYENGDRVARAEFCKQIAR